ncbi:integral membrane protein 2Ba isoform X2 [Oryzias melastigma]|uniref:integral membrane protein 2Ba isoform X2 n=1 Tax=Oryzias melastigma TaxID=30732 RepID=UPI000CF7E518|nr:integral membrane protein 2Ba isoform X2 [Oryzias melastigma]
MVKVSFNSALSQKEVKKDDESLIPEEEVDAEAALPVHRQSRTWCWCVCLGMALMLSGVLIAGAYLFRYFTVETDKDSSFLIPEREPVFFCGVNYIEDNYMMRDEEMDVPSSLRELEMTIRILEEEQVEIISVPVPNFEDGDPADIVHDFERRLTAYLDLNLDKCYVIPLNTSTVMPPRDLMELLVNAGTYLPQSYLVHEEMVVTERLERVDQLGYFIYNLCRDKETFKLQRRDRILGIQKREALKCRKIRHFENKFVVETQICEP